VHIETTLVGLPHLASENTAYPVELELQVNNKECFSINNGPEFYLAILPLGNAKNIT
jgi:hypothetical protein